MIELFALILLSWLIVRILKLGDLVSVLGLNHSVKVYKVASLLFIITAICCLSGYFFRFYFAQEQFDVNPQLSFANSLFGFWETLRSVIFEELIFRGVLLYILIRKVGANLAIIISSFAFGLVHLLNINDWSNIVQIALTFLFPFLLGIVLAYSFLKLGSIYVPLAIHSAWNLVQNFIFHENRHITSIFIISEQPIVNVSYFAFFLIIAFPKIATIVVNYLILKNSRNLITPAHNTA